MSEPDALDVTLRLRSLDELFSPPDTTPFSEDYQVHSYTSGIEFIVDELSADPTRHRLHVTLVVAGVHDAEETAREVESAVRRYGTARLTKVDHDLAATRWRGLRVLAVSILAMFVLITASRLVDDDTSVIREVISEGFSIAGWVALWFPLELLSFTVWEYRMDRRVLRTLMDLDVTVISPDVVPER